MPSTLRWGLLSTANINRRLIPAIRAASRSNLVAVASRRLETAQAYAAEWNIPKAFGSYEDMLASDQVDAVYISLPNHLHAEWSIRALQAGKHVLCEKPFALNVAETDRMIAASRASDKVLAEAFMYRHHPQTQLVLEWVRSGRLGKVLNVDAVFAFKLDPGPNIRLDPMQGGGSLYDVGVYPLSYAQAIFGQPPSRVFGTPFSGPSGVDLSFSGHMEYGPNQTAQFFCSFDTPFQARMDIYGTSGRLLVHRPFSAIDEVDGFEFFPVEGDPVHVTFQPRELYLCEVEDMEAAALDGRPSGVSLEQTRNHMRTVDALLAAARSGRPQSLPA
jgi:xylose dehydrogenase (NAD/NADP)